MNDNMLAQNSWGFHRPGTQLPLTVFGVIGIFLNLLLIFMLSSKTKLHKTLKILLLLYSIIGLIAISILTLLIPIMLSSTNGAYIVNTMVRLPKQVTRVLICVYFLCYNCWFILLAYSFLYRCLVARSKEKIVFNRIGYIIMVFGGFIGAVTSPIICWIFSTTPYYDPAARTAERMSGHNLSDLSFIGSEYFTKEGKFGNGMLMSTVVVATLVPFFLIMLGSMANYFLWYRKKHASVTKETFKKHYKLFQLLMLQTITPFVFSYIPPVIIYILALYSVTVSDNINYVVSSLMFATQILDPIWIFYFVKDFNEKLCCCWK